MLKRLAVVLSLVLLCDFGIAGQAQSSRQEHVGRTTGLAISPDGRIGATLGPDGLVRFWDLLSGKQSALLSFAEGEDEPSDVPSELYDACFSPDGKILAVGHSDGITLFSVADRERIADFDHPNSEFIDFDPSGKIIAAGKKRAFFDFTLEEFRTTPEIALFEVSSGETLQTLNAHAPFRFTPDGKSLAVSGDSGQVWIQERITASDEDEDEDEELPEAYGLALTDEEDPITAIDFNGSGKYLISAIGGMGGPLPDKVRIWDMASKRIVPAVDLESISVVLPIAADRFLILLGGFEGNEVAVMDLSKPKNPPVPVATDLPNLAEKVRISKNGKTIFWLDANEVDLHVIDGEKLKLLRTIEGRTTAVTSLAFHPDGKSLYAGYDDERVIVWDTTSGSQKRTIGEKRRIRHRDGRGSAVLSPDGMHFIKTSDHFSLFNSINGESVASNLSFGGADVSFSPNGQFAVISDSDSVRVYGVSAGRMLKKFPNPRKVVSNVVAISGDGKLVAISPQTETSTAATITIKNRATGALRCTIRGLADLVSNFQFSSDGKVLYIYESGDEKTVIRAFSAVNCKPLRTFENRSSKFALSPDGKLMATLRDLDVVVDIINTSTGETIASTDNGDDEYPYEFTEDIALAFSADSSKVVVGGSQGLIIFDAVTGKPLRRIL